LRQWNQTAPIGAIYQHYRARPELLLSTYLVVRGRDRPAVRSAIRSAIESVDPLVPYSTESLERRIGQSMAGRTLVLFIAPGFAGVALLLSAAGIHALVAQSVERRRRESGIRLILGARAAQVRRRVVGHGLRSTLAGMAIGGLASLAAVRAIRSQLFGVEVFDPGALAGSFALLALTAWLAAWVPARRSGQVDPARLLRED